MDILSPQERLEAPELQHKLEWAFLILHVVGGQLALPILLATFLVPSHRRFPSLQRCHIMNNFIFSWILSSIIQTLALYSMRSTQSNLNLDPPLTFCLVQASLVVAARCMTAITGFSLAVNVWLCVHSPGSCYEGYKLDIQYIVIALSYIVFISIFMVVFVVGSHLPTYPTATPFYCIILDDGSPLSWVQGKYRIPLLELLFGIIMEVLTFMVEAHLIYILLTRYPKGSRGPLKWSLIRVGSFSIYRGIAIVMAGFGTRGMKYKLIAGAPTPQATFQAAVEIVQATFPLVIFILFSCRWDVLEVWWQLITGRSFLPANSKDPLNDPDMDVKYSTRWIV